MLVDMHGNLLATSDPDEYSHIGKLVTLTGLTDALHGKASTQVDYNPTSNSDAIDMWVPVIDQDHQILGVMRLNLPVKSLQDKISSTRTLVFWILGASLLLGAVLGWVLALSIERPLKKATSAIQDYSNGKPLEALPEKGPSELRLLVRAFNSLTERLQLLEESRRKLLSNLIHELGRPLGAMHSAIQALQGGADRNKALRHELLDGMGGEIRRLERLLDELSHLHDQGIGILELNIQTTTGADWLLDSLAPWREAALAKGLRWQIEVQPDLPDLKLDPDRIVQAAGNLVSNAIKYTPTHGSIQIQAYMDGGEFVIQVKDSGSGIDNDEKEAVFSPFYRGRTSKRFPQGMGLGLTIARDLVTAHQGYIEVESILGEGSTFTIHIPQAG
jgi:signal transduction histidine kinase